MDYVELGEVAGEGVAGELRAVVSEHSGELDADLAEALDDMVHEVGGTLGGLVADEEPAEGPTGGGVDRGERRTVPTPLSLPT